MTWAGVIDQYESWGYQLIPLDPFAKDPRNKGKKPRDDNWTLNTYDYMDLWSWAMQGGLHNLGACIGPRDLVIDVDPRNGGDASFEKLKKEINEDFSNAPTVTTGGGGLHVYLRHIDEVPLISNEFTEYPGIEWKRKGRQVVVPNSTHPLTGKKYLWANDVKVIPPLPGELLDFLAKFEYKAPLDQGTEEALSGEVLAEVLSRLPVEKYDSNDLWFKILAASYHATGGSGLDEFVSWSTSDPAYREHERLIAARWRSLERPTVNKRSLGTLIYELKKHKRDIPETLSKKHSEYLEDFIPEITVEETVTALEALGCESTATEVTKVLKQITHLGPLEQVDALAKLQEVTGRTKGSLAEALKVIKREGKSSPKNDDTKMIDVSYDVARQVLSECFDKGSTLVRALDDRYWRYSRTHWKPYSSDELKSLIMAKAEQYREASPAIKFQVSSVILSAEIVVRAAVAKGVDLLGKNRAPSPVVNCHNCELWINEDGSVARKEHSPGSLLTHCLPIEYDVDAKCKLFQNTLKGIFSPFSDSEEVVRHLWEVFGYTIQPRKSIPSWFLFQGYGANGKSLILDVLIALLGPAARSISSIADLTSSRSEFALSECIGALAIIDDDVKKGTVLNDDVLKKISEDKTIRARFLHKNFVDFRNCAVTLLAANGWPQTRDVSEGMMRRAYGFPFRRRFAHDDKRKQRIISNELPGVLNGALKGYERLRKRGSFDVPRTCVAFIEKWKTKSNQVLGYLAEHHESGHWVGLKSFEILWEGYENWSRTNGIRRLYSKPGFREALLSYGIKDGELGMEGLNK